MKKFMDYWKNNNKLLTSETRKSCTVIKVPKIQGF